MDPLEASLEALAASGLGLRVAFAREGDRWRHQVLLVSGDRQTPMLESREGTSADDWPVSPPFQELSRETLPDGREVLFLIGRAGASHWSASIEAVSDPPQLVFDVACRHGQSPRCLGSAYQVVAAGLSLQAIGSDTAVRAAVDEILVTPGSIAARLPGTTRWKYRVVLDR